MKLRLKHLIHLMCVYAKYREYEEKKKTIDIARQNIAASFKYIVECSIYLVLISLTIEYNKFQHFHFIHAGNKQKN